MSGKVDSTFRPTLRENKESSAKSDSIRSDFALGARLPRRMRLGKPDAAAKERLYLGQEGAAGGAVEDERGEQLQPGPAVLDRGNEQAVRGRLRARMDGQDVEGAEALAERGEEDVEPVGAEDDGEAPAAASGSPTPPRPTPPARPRRGHGRPRARIVRRGAGRGGLVEGRVDQDLVGRSACGEDGVAVGDIGLDHRHAPGKGAIGDARRAPGARPRPPRRRARPGRP